jgi:hypothetical protein
LSPRTGSATSAHQGLESAVDRRRIRQRARPDWPAIEVDYRAGGLSLRQMAAKHRCAPSTIANKATRDGWTRRDGRPRDRSCGPASSASPFTNLPRTAATSP